MSDLADAIRAKMAADDGRYADEIWWDAYRDAILAVLELHTDPETDRCVREHDGHTVAAWHDPDTDPTLRVIAEKLGAEVPC